MHLEADLRGNRHVGMDCDLVKLGPTGPVHDFGDADDLVPFEGRQLATNGVHGQAVNPHLSINNHGVSLSGRRLPICAARGERLQNR